MSTLSIHHFIILSIQAMAITDSTNPQANITGSPIQNDAATTPNTNDLDLSLDLPPVVQETTPDTDRLKEEDKLVQSVAPVEAPVEEVKPETITETIQANLPESSDKNPLQSSLQDDMNIIKNLENTATVTPQPAERILETKNPDPVVVMPPVVDTQPSTINLDSLLADTTPTAAPVAPAKSPFDLIQTDTPTVVPTPNTVAVNSSAIIGTNLPTSKTKGVKIGLFVILFVALGFLTYFIISTMYPMGFFASNTNTGVTIAETTGDILTGEVIFTGTEIVATDTGMTDTGHASASDANFQDINDMMPDASSTTLSQDAIVVKLNNYQELGTKYLAASKAVNDLQSMKYAVYLKNKSQTVLDEIIANPNAITTMQSDLTTQLAQFETFLQQLITKYGDLSASASTQTTPDQILNSLTQE